MIPKIYSSKYKDQEAVTIESDLIRAQLLPGIGAKIASLVYKPLNYEVLVQRPGKKYLIQPFDGDFVAGECSGIDDMFPTIDMCFYDRFPWEGIKMADHGEVWSLPWDFNSGQDNRLHFSVNGVRFPYRFEKWVSFSAPGILRTDYRLTNLSGFDLDYVWAVHPLFNLEEGVELVLPEGVDRVVRTFSLGSEVAQYGDECNWPVAVMADGTQRDFRWLRPKSAKQADKYFIKGKMPEGWCGLKFHHSNFSLAYSFPVDKVPFLGLLPNEGAWQDIYNIFLEPGTASFDRPDAARYRKEVSTLKAKAVFEWHLNLTLTEGTDFRSCDENGFLEVKK